MATAFKEEIKGIGIVEHNFSEFHNLEFGKDCSIKSYDKFHDDLQLMIERDVVPNFLFVPLKIVANKLSYEYVCYLETIGVNVTAYSKHYPYGTYALDFFINRESGADIILRFSKFFDSTFRLFTKRPTAFDKRNLNDQGFKNIYTSAQVISFCQKVGKNSYKWHPPFILPDGMHCSTPMTAADQYAQSCFEGLVSMSGNQNNMVVLRPSDNAKRIRQSTESIAIPPISEECFLNSLEYGIKANKDYMPSSDENFKIYIRPYVKGLEGGYGIGPANSYLFCIQVFPFGDYIGRKDSSIKLVSLEGKRRSHGGGFGSLKVSGNYAQTILDREKARQAIFDSKVYDDIFYFGESKVQIQIGDEKHYVLKEVLDEDAAGNLFFFKVNDKGIKMITPPLSRGSFLGGFTRDTVMKLAQYLSVDVEEKELTFQELTHFDGAFLTGSAVGLSKIKSMTFKGQEVSFYLNDKSNEFFGSLFDSLYALRRGFVSENDNRLNGILKNLITSYYL